MGEARRTRVLENEAGNVSGSLLRPRLLGAFALFDLFDELGNDFENVADDTEVGVLKDRRLGVFIDGNDKLGGLHS